MAIESKNLLVWVKAMSRGQALPLDASEVHASWAEAQAYAKSPIAYPGQTIKALMEDGKYHQYILQPSESGYILEEAGGAKPSDLKQYVLVVEVLPDEAQEEGVLYIRTGDATGWVWTAGAWKCVFKDVTEENQETTERVEEIETALENKAPIENPVFTGTVKVGEDEVALKSYVDGMIANMVTAAPGIADAEHPIPEGYKAGEHYRVAEAGEYAGHKCEVGDVLLAINDYAEGAVAADDFIVLQANIDGAVTSAAETAFVGEIVVFDAVTGKVIKGSGVQIASLNEAIAKAHEHANKEILDSYDKTQSELLAEAKTEAENLVAALDEKTTTALGGKADKANTLAGYGIEDAYTKTEIDGKIQTITENLNTKVSASEVDAKVTAGKNAAVEEAAAAAKIAMNNRIGDIPEDTSVKSYIDTAVGSGGTASAEAIANAKQEAINTSKDYTDEKVAAAMAITVF